jgi:hypothetical protein
MYSGRVVTALMPKAVGRYQILRLTYPLVQTDLARLS